MTSHPDAGRGRRHANLRSGLGMGLLAGVTAIMCCVSPVLLVLLGVLTAVEAISLGETLYYEYGWYFRGAGLLVAALAVLIYLRRRNSCSVGGARRHWIALATLPVTAVITYVALFWLTKYLGIWSG